MRRSRLKIFALVLESSLNGSKITNIINKCNISWKLANIVIDQLLESQLLRIGNSFHTTEKGLKYLDKWKSLESIIEKNQLNSKMLHNIPDPEYFARVNTTSGG